MNAASPDLPAPLTLTLEGEMTIRRAAELKPLLQPALAHPGGVHLDLAAVSEIDTTGLQLLLATKQAIQTDGRPFSLTDSSRAVVDVIELLGLLEALYPHAVAGLGEHIH
ncbi:MULTISPECIES: lipid asymmetry maintenance protein MlaB [Xanthomonas]|uniref:STAS domain-containing protein n=1 Tax=Xanthomonas dyei TaxID=743699 RepID=A0ABZ0D4H9_9XANT|nr:STAS domain-containing protein [Xanthomonas dyei]MCC4632463.1 STAS domain-containing protein [Xanthomonas dyei pv. eucalypti]WOB25149.1 STAS domain-containing protein [Xanthomonas dyei]WOB52776.1 STAS domain-containing protein [Xanthomonas dyei]